MAAKLAFSRMIVADIPPQHTPNTDANLLGIPAELRLQILSYLLPDVAFVPFRFLHKDALIATKPQYQPTACPSCGLTSLPPPPPPPPGRVDLAHWTRSPQQALVPSEPDLRTDGARCSVAVMRTCQRVHQECIGILYTRDRIFEATINWEPNRMHGHSMSALSYPRIALPRDQRAFYPFSIPTIRFHAATAMDYLMEVAGLDEILAPIVSLQLTLPIYRVAMNHESVEEFRGMLSKLVDLLRDKGDDTSEAQSLRRLKVNLVSECDGVFTPRDWSTRPSKANQRVLKWIAEPFARILSKPGITLEFSINGESIQSIPLQERWPQFCRYAFSLSGVPYESIAAKLSTNMPIHLERLAKLGALQESVAILHTEAMSIQNIGTAPAPNPPPIFHGMPPPPPPFGFIRYRDPKMTVWDLWATGNWDRLDRKVRTVRDAWTNVNGILEPIISSVERDLRRRGKQPLHEPEQVELSAEEASDGSDGSEESEESAAP